MNGFDEFIENINKIAEMAGAKEKHFELINACVETFKRENTPKPKEEPKKTAFDLALERYKK